MKQTVWLVLALGMLVLLAGCPIGLSLGKPREQAAPAAAPVEPAPAPVAESPAVAEPVAPTPQAPAQQPGLQAALDAAKASKPGWAAQVHDHNSDWSTVEVLVGPTSGDWRTGMNYRWTFRGYELVSEGPLNPPQPTTVIVERQAPPKTIIVKQRPAQPPPSSVNVRARENAARATARAQFGRKGTTTKLVSESGRWSNVTMRVLAPNGTVIGQVSMRWNGNSMSVTSVQRN